jgi:hypothetical protein
MYHFIFGQIQLQALCTKAVFMLEMFMNHMFLVHSLLFGISVVVFYDSSQVIAPLLTDHSFPHTLDIPGCELGLSGYIRLGMDLTNEGAPH